MSNQKSATKSAKKPVAPVVVKPQFSAGQLKKQAITAQQESRRQLNAEARDRGRLTDAELNRRDRKDERQRDPKIIARREAIEKARTKALAAADAHIKSQAETARKNRIRKEADADRQMRARENAGLELLANDALRNLLKAAHNAPKMGPLT